jgi:hypothetical protein
MEPGHALPELTGLDNTCLHVAGPAGGRRLLLDQVAKPLDRLDRSLSADLNPTVVHVTGESDQTELKGPCASPPAEPDPLNPTPDKDRGAPHEAEPTRPYRLRTGDPT